MGQMKRMGGFSTNFTKKKKKKPEKEQTSVGKLHGAKSEDI